MTNRRDELGDVIAAFRDLQSMAEQLRQEILAMNAAISGDRLDHRTDLGEIDGGWRQLLDDMNDTMATFADLQDRGLRAEREARRFFELSLDLLAIAGLDGYIKRINPAGERMLGYPAEVLLSRPFLEFVHPDDRERTLEALAALARGADVVQFENRYVRSDGSLCWLEWSSRPALEEGLIYAAGRNVTDSRRAAEEQAALRRVATLVARGVAPDLVFAAVAEEVGNYLPGADLALVGRYDSGQAIEFIGGWSRVGNENWVGRRVTLGGENVVTLVFNSNRPARADYLADEAAAMTVLLRRAGVRAAAGAPINVEGRLWGVISVGSWREAGLPTGIEHELADFTELVGTAIANTQAREELAASRARIVNAADDARRRIERDLHDGVQQRLVVLGLQVQAARGMVDAPTVLREQLSNMAEGLTRTLDDLRELSHGIHPGILTRGGLRAAIQVLARRSPLRVDVELPRELRLPESVEVAAYYIACEALTNAAKHARASSVQISGDAHDGRFEFTIRDDGIGGATSRRGSGLIGLADRVEALGGSFQVASPLGSGTALRVALPVAPAPGAPVLDRSA